MPMTATPRTSLRSATIWIGVLSALIAVHLWSLDGILGNAFLLVFGDDSSYSSGYSDRRFRTIEIGDSEASVIGALGEPLETVSTDEPEAQVLHFSVSLESTHYRIRAIEIRDERVIQKHAQAWVD